MKRLLLICLTALALSVSFANAQAPTSICVPGTNSTTGQPTCVPVTASNPLPTTGGASSISGFAPNGNYATLTATNISANVALPTNTGTVVVYNTGTTAVSCNLTVGAGIAVPNQIQIQPGSSAGFAVGTNNNISCIDQTGSVSNLIIIAGGSGLPTGGGGGGSGGTVTVSGGSVTAIQPTGTTTETKLTISVTNTYQQALASNVNRKGCLIQYISVAGTKGFVFFGSTPADTTTSFQLTNGQSIPCQMPGITLTDAVQVTATANDIFIVATQ